MNDGCQGYEFAELSNRNDLYEILKNNKEYLDSNITALRLDNLLGIKDDYIVDENELGLRDYQQIAVDRIEKIYETKRYAGVILPTGAGKSFIAMAEMIKFKNQNILYYAPNIEILRQVKKHIILNILKLHLMNEKEEEYYSQHLMEKSEDYIFESEMDEIIKRVFPYLKLQCYQGILNKEEEFFESRNASLIIFDEAHRAGGTQWNKQIRKLIFNNPNAKLLGITATPKEM